MLDSTLVGIADRLGRRLRTARRVFRTVVLRLRFDDFTRATRSHTLPDATMHTGVILATARALLRGARTEIVRRGVTLVGLSLTNLENTDAMQLVLPIDRRRALDTALDDVRERYGTAAITRGVLLGRDQGFSVPLLPD
jgi:DNA polymerase-4